MFDSALTLDIPFSRKVLEHLRAHPEEHNQNFYGAKTSCGTRACIAGTAMLMDAATTVFWDDDGLSTRVAVGNEPMDIDKRAAQLLGLNGSDAIRLFHNYNNANALDQLESHIEAAEAAQA